MILTSRAISDIRKISLGEQFSRNAFRPSGFDYMRLILAISVLIPHAGSISTGDVEGARVFSSFGPYFKSVLPAFFALSGFLVAGSMERSKTLISFLGLRAIRIYPALTVEVVLSALLIGPLVTTYPLARYFSDPKFWRYLVNVTGHISFYLPGVFTHNPRPDLVNYQLWTVPWELVCYISLTALILLGVKRYRPMVLIGLLATLGGALIQSLALPLHHHNFHLVPLSGHVWNLDLVLFFLCGVAAYLYRNEIPYSWPLFWAALVTSTVAFEYIPLGQYIAAIPLTYCTVFLGLCNPKRTVFIKLADASYGIYLYGYVIQQYIAYQFPWSHTWYINFALTLPIASFVGLLSWFAVEKPAMKLRDPLKSLETSWLMKRERARAKRVRSAPMVD